MKKTFCTFLVLFCFLLLVLSDYGHGGKTRVHTVPSNGKGGKWSIRAKGKGMQNLMTHHGGGGGHHTEYVYVPHYDHGGGHSYDHHMTYGHSGYDHGGYDHGGHDHGGYGGYSQDNEVAIIPVYGGHGGHGDYGGYGHEGYGHSGYMQR